MDCRLEKTGVIRCNALRGLCTGGIPHGHCRESLWLGTAGILCRLGLSTVAVMGLSAVTAGKILRGYSAVRYFVVGAAWRARRT